MADDLRARIAAVLQGSWPAPWFDGGRQHQQVADLADAVIRELGLREEWTWTWPRSNKPDSEWAFGLIVDSREEAVIEGDGRCLPAYRYVTEWTADA